MGPKQWTRRVSVLQLLLELGFPRSGPRPHAVRGTRYPALDAVRGTRYPASDAVRGTRYPASKAGNLKMCY